MNANIPFKIFPSIGYCNSSFQIQSFENNISVELFKEEKLIDIYNITKNNFIIIKELRNPGAYVAKCTIENRTYTQKIKVENMFRWGSSILKKAYAFENINYSFFLLKDRMLVYDEKKHNTFIENYISPSHIEKIDESHLLFFTHKLNGRNKNTNVGIYSLKSLSIIDELVNQYHEIDYNNKTKVLWLLDKDKNLLCFDLEKTKKLIPDYTIEKVINITKNEDHKLIIVEQEETIIFIDSIKNKIVPYEKNDSSIIDKCGYFIESINSIHYVSNPIREKHKVKITLPDNINIVKYLDHIIYLGSNYYQEDNQIEFDSRVDEIVKYTNIIAHPESSYGKVNLSENDRISYTTIKHEIFFLRNEIILNEIEIKKKLFYIKYKINNNQVLKTADIQITNIQKLKYPISEICNIAKKQINYSSIEYINEDFIKFNCFNKKILCCNTEDIIFEESTSFSAIENPERNKSFLLVTKDGKDNKKLFTLYNSENLKFSIFNCDKIFNLDFIKHQGIIWFEKVIEKKIYGYSLLNNKTINFNESFFKKYTFQKDYFISSDNEIYKATTGELKNIANGIVESFSENFTKLICRKNDEFFLFTNNPDNTITTKKINLESEIYSESYLSPNGRFIMFKKRNNSYCIYDMRKNKTEEFVTDNFIRFNQKNQIIVKDITPRTIKIIDPESFELISSAQADFYEFQSPDSKLYAASRIKLKYFDLLNENEISITEFNNTRLLLSNNDTTFFIKNKNKLESIGITDKNQLMHIETKILKFKKYVTIGITGTSKIIDLEIPDDIAFYNYASFSHDNTYLSIVGKPSSRGMILIVKLNFDSINQELSESDRFLSYLPQNATWTCGISKQGDFATYDSKPDTYIIKCDDNLFINENETNKVNQDFIKDHISAYYNVNNLHIIKGKNFLSFSPTGKYMALSEQGYDPLSLGGYGHQESETVHIYNIAQKQIIDSFYYHGSPIKIDTIKKLIFVSFSIDESKLLSLGTDGVVYFRNLDLFD